MSTNAIHACKKHMIELLLRPRQGFEADPTYPLMVPGEPPHHDWQALGRLKAAFDDAVLATATARSPLLSSSSSVYQQQQQPPPPQGSPGGQGLGPGAVAPSSSSRRQRFQYCRAEDRSVDLFTTYLDTLSLEHYSVRKKDKQTTTMSILLHPTTTLPEPLPQPLL